MGFNRLAVIIFLALSLTACNSPGSHPYQPRPKWESGFFKDARRDVFPDDVRQSLNRYKQTLVAWPGIIKSIKYRIENNSRVATITAEHHYFDWIEDRGAQREIFFLSPRGEGEFVVAWGEYTEEDITFLKQFAVGDMLIAYGQPSEIRDKAIGLHPLMNIRSIKPMWFRTDVLDYGRPGGPVRTLRTPF